MAGSSTSISATAVARTDSGSPTAAIASIAARHGKTPSQIVLRWHVKQDGVAAIPKAGSAGHQRDNLDVFGFVLPDEDMRALSALAKPDGRLVKPGFMPEWDR